MMPIDNIKVVHQHLGRLDQVKNNEEIEGNKRSTYLITTVNKQFLFKNPANNKSNKNDISNTSNNKNNNNNSNNSNNDKK